MALLSHFMGLISFVNRLTNKQTSPWDHSNNNELQDPYIWQGSRYDNIEMDKLDFFVKKILSPQYLLNVHALYINGKQIKCRFWKWYGLTPLHHSFIWKCYDLAQKMAVFCKSYLENGISSSWNKLSVLLNESNGCKICLE